jgi:diguanylate cyclase (GGDEF)-like protein
MPAFRLSLRTAVTAPFVAVFVVTVGLLAFWQQRQVEQLIQQESLRLLDSITTTSRHRLAEYLEAPLQIQQAMARAAARQDLYRPGDMGPMAEYLTRAFTQLYAQHGQISLLSFGGARGEYVGVRREGDGRFQLIRQDDSTQGMLRIFPGLDPRAEASGLPGYDPRVRPWYRAAIEADTSAWSPIYTVTGDRGDVTLSASTPVRNADGVAGVLAADVRLSSMSRFLSEEPLRGNGHIAVVDGQGYVVAHSVPGTVLLSQGDPYQPPLRMRLSDCPEPALRKAASLLDFSDTPGQTAPLRFTEQELVYYGQVSSFHDARGINWRIVVLLPESDLVSTARADSRNALLGALAIAMLGLVLGLWWLRRAVQPMVETAHAVHRLAGGDWQAVQALPPTPVVEISSLVDACNHMALRLQQSFEHMRTRLLNDPLTHLLTRAGLIEQAEAASHGPHPSHASLCLLELQDFRRIKDDLGHGTGEQLLQAVARRLQSRLQPGALLARTASCEFAVLWLRECTPEQVRRGCEQVLDLFARPFSVGKDDILLRACAGAVTGRLEPGILTEWLRNASMALGEAERALADDLGAYPFLLFEPALAQRMAGRTQLTMELRQALDRDELQVFYQPVVDLATGRMAGAEALLRWSSPTRGMVPPGVFIPLAEESDLILGIGDWTLRRAARDIASHRDQLPQDFELHVNVSARELIQSDFALTLEQVLQASGLPPHMLTLELTESMLLEGNDATLRRIAAIKALGVRIAIDDFGTGYSSLAYLSRLRFDCIKIDQSFVAGLSSSQANTAIVTAVLRMAEGFGLEVVAEGVEEAQQADLLRELGCLYAQGYLFERPVPLERMLAYRPPVGFGRQPPRA